MPIKRPSCVAVGVPCYAQRSSTRCRFSHCALISTVTSNPQLLHRAAEDARVAGRARVLDLIRTLTQVEHVRKRCLDFPGRPASQYKGYLEPASVEHPNTPSAPDAVDITVVCSRLAVTLHFTRHPLAYRSRAASAALACVGRQQGSRDLVSVYPRHKQPLPLPGRLSIQGCIVESFHRLSTRPLGNSLQLRNCRFHEFDDAYLDPGRTCYFSGLRSCHIL